ncbi:MAG: T9SS type A sorting domain-containing protein [Bacteroidetes bacterium]|nr:T9SS type A sorting domain-containing protein [Bacteroidota bacterium]
MGSFVTVTVNVSGGTTPYTGTGTYTTNVSSTTYTVTDDNGCEATTNVTLTVNALPVLVATSTSSLLCSGETATLSVSGANTYTWSTTEQTATIEVTPTSQTTYTVDGTDVNGCSASTTITQDVSLCTGIAALNNAEVFISAYPNPTKGIFYIELTSEAKVTITNAIGQVIINETMQAGKNSIDIQHQSTGIYFVNVNHNGKQLVIKLIKE